MGVNGALIVVLTAPKHVGTTFTYQNYFLTYMKLLTTKYVDYFGSQGRDFWKETLLMKFSNVFSGPVSTKFRAPFSPIIFEKRHKSPELDNSHQNYLD